MKKSIIGLVMSSLLTFALSYWGSNYKISEEYTIQFETKKAKGNLQGLEGTISFDPNQLETSKMDVKVAVNTIATGNTKKDKHAVGKKWFNAEAYPYISFVSSKIEQLEEGYQVRGNLTIKDVTQEVSIPFNYVPKDNGMLLEGQLMVKRKDYHI
ncbi:MAG: YceI family protein, partial [Bacteroidota bacterium]